jgi:glycosyltransferase involved in cell wall biosynthesis
LRICHVIESAAGGSAAIMVSLAVDAVRRGHEVALVYSPDRADPNVVAALNKGGVTRLVPSQMQRSIGPWDLRDGLGLRKAIAGLGAVDVVHSHSSKAGALARAFGPHRRTAQIYSPHGFYTMTGEAPFYIGPVERGLSLLGDRIIAVSEFERRHAIELGIAPAKVVVVANGLAPYQPMGRLQARKELGLDRQAFVVGFVGRLADQKNPLEAIDVVSRVPGATLAIIGDGELRAKAEAVAAISDGAAVLLGPRDAKPLFSAFDCLLCTSLYEGMPVSFLEALNCGVPIVSYPVGGTEELVADGQTGFVVEPRAEAAAAAIDNLMRMSAAQRENLSQACRAMAASHSDAEMGRQTLAVYESALKR